MPASVHVSFFKDNILGAQQRKMPRMMTEIATKYANRVKRLMRDSPATGRIYKRGRKVHQASAPGEPPAPDTGNLARSVRWRVREYEGGLWVAEVGSTLPYALYLEFGAARGVVGSQTGRGGGTPSRIKYVQWILFPRPAWGPALRAMRYEVPEIVRKYGARSTGRVFGR